MNQRAGKNKYYKKIEVCDRWKDFDNFYRDMIDDYDNFCEKHGEKNTTIERVDRNRGYSKENCIWAGWETQANNRKNSRYLTYKNETLSLSEWARKIGISRQNLWKRLNNGWSIERSLKKDGVSMKNNANAILLDEIIRKTLLGHFGTKNRSELLSMLYKLKKL